MFKKKKNKKEKKLRFFTETQLNEYDPRALFFMTVRQDHFLSQGWYKDFSKFEYPNDWDEQKALNLIKGWLKQDIPDDHRKELEIVLKRIGLLTLS